MSGYGHVCTGPVEGDGTGDVEVLAIDYPHSKKLKDRKNNKKRFILFKNPGLNTKIFNYCGFKMVPDCKTKQLITVVLK